MRGGAGLGWIVAGQFIGTLADNALLLIAIETLAERHAPAWTAPALRIAFYLTYVLLSAHASAIADAWPKKLVLASVNALKACGCALLLCGTSPLLAYALVGIGAAAHAPARYGILSELSPPHRLVAANAWMEGATVLAMLLGILWGSLMRSLEGRGPGRQRQHGEPSQPLIGLGVYGATVLLHAGLQSTVAAMGALLFLAMLAATVSGRRAPVR